MDKVKEMILTLLEVPDGEQWDHQRFTLLAVILDKMADHMNMIEKAIFKIKNINSLDG